MRYTIKEKYSTRGIHRGFVIVIGDVESAPFSCEHDATTAADFIQRLESAKQLEVEHRGSKAS